MSSLFTDVRFGLRMIAKRPGTSALAVLALALGIGLTTTMFSIVHGAILRGLPFEESERIMHLGRLRPAQGPDDFAVSAHDFLDWKARQKSFSDLIAFTGESAIVSGTGGAAERYRSARMSAGTLTLLRTSPTKGRDFLASDEVLGAPAVAIISHRVWETHFTADPNVVGRTFRLNGVPTEVVGVMAPKFAFPMSQDVWLPLQMAVRPVRGEGETYSVIGRLAPGATLESATTEMVAIAAQLEAAHVENKGITVQIKPFVDEFLGQEVKVTLFAMLGAVFGVLLIACANVMNLQLARALERTREIAIRTAMGAERWRILRQMLIEGLLLAAAGALIGIGIAHAGVTLFNAGISDTNPPFWIDIRLDRSVLFFVLLLTVSAAIVSTLVPALRATRRRANEILKDQARGTTSLRAGLLSRALVAGAVTLSTALLIISGLMIKSVVQVGRTSYAFATEDVLMARSFVDRKTYTSDQAILDLTERLTLKLSSVPGVRSVGFGTNEPGSGGAFVLTRDPEPVENVDERPAVRRIVASASYFDALGLKATRGRVFGGSDRAGTERVVVITEDVATHFFEGRDPLGQRIRLSRDPKTPWRTIVGVVPTLVSMTERNGIPETVFVPLAQEANDGLTIFLRTDSDPMKAAPGVRAAVRDVDQDLPLSNVDSLGAFLYKRGWAFRVFGSLFFAFGAAALIMAVAGLYGVLAFGVRMRTQEIGVRLALGADKGRVVRMILTQGMRLVAIGLALGLTIGWLAAPLMAELFFNVTPTDPFVFGTTALALALTGVVASLVPAFRAASTDPVVALRQEI